MTELKPCPFCGGEAWLLHTNDNHHKPYVQCKFGVFKEPKCPLGHLITWDYDTEEQAAEAWNRRSERK